VDEYGGRCSGRSSCSERHQLVVFEHPLPGRQVPESVWIAASANDHAENHAMAPTPKRWPGVRRRIGLVRAADIGRTMVERQMR